MVRTWFAVIAAVVGVSLISTADAQTPELTVVARSPKDLQIVLNSLGERGESYGLGGPAAFLTDYEQHLDSQKPLTAACAFSTSVPMFAAEFMLVDSTQWWSALSEDGFVLDAKSGQLANDTGSLTFFVEQTGNRIRISDNADYLKAIRLPVAPTFGASSNESAVVMHVDWRNLKPEVRTALATQVLGLLLPQSQTLNADVSLANLPEALSVAASSRIASWFTRSETLDLRFQIDDHQRIQLAVDVANRTLTGLRVPPTPFADSSIPGALAQGQWNLPIEFEFRNFVQALAAQFNGDVKGLFAGDQIEGTQGRDVVQEGSRLLARHALEIVSQPNLQGTFAATERDGRPLLAAGLRLANPAKFDSDLQKLLKAATEDGAPFKLALNQPNSYDANLHRIEIPIATELKEARELFGEVAIINLATTPHAVLIGIGEGSEELMNQLVTAGNVPSGNLISAIVAAQSPLGNKLGLSPATISAQPTAQGIRIFSTLPETQSKDGRLTRTPQ